MPPCPIDEIKPVHVRQYLDWRKSAKVRANREKALLSHIFNFAREWGYTDKTNPCQGIKGYKETGHDVYITDDEYNKLWQASSAELRNALDLAYLTGQRPADVLKMCAEDIINNELHIKQNKVSSKLRISINGDLKTLIDKLPKEGKLLRNEDGHNLTYYMLRRLFDNARTKAGIDFKNFQFKDLRAKAATDKDETQGIIAAKDQLGHTSEKMTRNYIRHRQGKKATPTK